MPRGFADEVRTVDALGPAVPQVTPRPELRARVLDMVEARGQVVEFRAEAGAAGGAGLRVGARGWRPPRQQPSRWRRA